MKAIVLGVWLALVAIGCGGAVGATPGAGLADAAPPTCTIDGTRYPACDNEIHDYAVMLHDVRGSAIFCASESATTSQPCASGGACTVATKTTLTHGVCL